VFYKGKMFIVPGKSKKKEFVEEIMYAIEDPYRVVKSQEKFDKLSKNDPVVGGYFEDTNGPAYTKFMEAAKGMQRRRDVTYALLARDNPNWAKALVGGANRVLLKSGKRSYSFTEFEDSDKNFTSWVEVKIQPLFQKYSYDLKKKWENVGLDLPVVKVFLDEDEPGKKLKRKVQKIAESFSEKLSFLYYPKNQDHAMAITGLQKSDKPAFAISTSLKDDEAKHYAFRGSLSPKHLQQHCDAFLAGTLEETFKTQLNPYDPAKNKTWEVGTPQQIVQTTWQSEIVESDLNIVLLMYKNWTTNKEPAIQVLTGIAALWKTFPYLKFALYDYHENYWNHKEFTDKKHESDLQLYFYTPSKERISCVWAKDKDADWSMESVVEWVIEQFKDDESKASELRLRHDTFVEFAKQKEEESSEPTVDDSALGENAIPETHEKKEEL